MEEKRKSNGLLVGVLIAVIVCLLVFIGLVAAGLVSFKFDSTSKKEESGTIDTTEETSDENKVSDDDKYSAIIEEYRSAINDSEYIELTNAEEKYPNINGNMMHYYHNDIGSEFEFKFKYTYYDINKDGNNELIIGPMYEIYTYDGNKANRLINENCLGERCSVALYNDGTIHFEGSGGAAIHGYAVYKIGADGNSRKTIKDYTVEYTDQDGKTFVVTNNITNQTENFLSIDELESSLIGSAKKVDMTKLDWKEIK